MLIYIWEHHIVSNHKKITKAQMWNLLEVLILVFWSSYFLFFPGSTPTCNGKGSRGCSNCLYIYGAIWLLTSYSESAGLLPNDFVSSNYPGALCCSGPAVWILKSNKVRFCFGSGLLDLPEHAESFSLLPVYEKLVENYLRSFHLSSQLRWATGFKCVYTHLYTVELFKPCFRREST